MVTNCVEIKFAGNDDYEKLISVWQSSIETNHQFLSADDRAFFKENLTSYFSYVSLYKAVTDEDVIVGFIGLSGQNIEMLFVSANAQGMGIGKMLMEFAIDKYKAESVDVNEQNQSALGFYEHLGFAVVGRSETDAQGKHYPILHMKLDNNG